MVAKKAVKKTVMKRVPKHEQLSLNEQLSLADRLKETEAKLERAVMGLRMAKSAVEMMAQHYEELCKVHEKAVKHIVKLERKLEKAK